MKKGDKVFVYGTLRQGECNDLSIRTGAKFLGEDKINGRLYRRGWYPGLKLIGTTGDFDPSQPTVTGEVYEITDEALPRHLDAYEGYPNLYDRSQVESERSHFVWTYTYNLPVGDNQLIPSGDWCNSDGDGDATTSTSVSAA